MIADAAPELFTVGHSNRELEDFLDLLDANAIELLVDVRAFPGSRRQPRFGSELLAQALAERDIDYLHARDLGGRRRKQPPELEAAADGWRHASFRSYGAYAQTEEYRAALAQLCEQAAVRRTVIMCSEAVPWRCHRWLVSDSLVAQDWRVLHIIDRRSVRLHQISSFAQVSGSAVTWPGPPSQAPLKLGAPVPV